MFLMEKHLQLNMNDSFNLKRKAYHKEKHFAGNKIMAKVPKAGPFLDAAGNRKSLMGNCGTCIVDQLALGARCGIVLNLNELRKNPERIKRSFSI